MNAADGERLVLDVIDGFDMVPLNAAILQLAEDPFPTTLGSLDAIHLASALQARMLISDLQVATHDEELAAAARAVGFKVLGAAP